MFVVMMIMVMMLVIGDVKNGKDGDVDLDDMSHSQMLGKVEYGLPAKI